MSRWTDDTPITMNLWNYNVYQQPFPLHMMWDQTQPFKLDFEVLIKLWKQAKNKLQPNRTPSLKCGIMVILPQVNPFWIQTPCQQENVLPHFICKRHKRNNITDIKGVNQITPEMCKKQLYLLQGICYKLTPTSARHIQSLKTVNNTPFITSISPYFKYTKGHFHLLHNNGCLTIHGDNEVDFSNVYIQRTFIIHKVSSFKVSKCSLGEFRCADGSCISLTCVCDGVSDCPHSEEEKSCLCYVYGNVISDSLYCSHECHPDNCTCQTLYKQLDNGGCQPYLAQLSIPQHGEYSGNSYHCNDGHTIPLRYVNDTVPDCGLGEDETQFQIILSQANIVKTAIISDHCSESELSCYPGMQNCFDISYICLYDFDMFGNMLHCRNGRHLQNCVDFPCSNTFKCSHSYCIPWRRVCDGIFDCPLKDDENHCEHYKCLNTLKCKFTHICVHPIEVCDGISHCPHGDDEILCNLSPCPPACSCHALAVDCHFANLTRLPRMSTNVIFCDLHNNNIQLFPNMFSIYSKIQILNLSKNKFGNICSVNSEITYFMGLSVITYLDLGHNMIQYISPNCFQGLDSLVELNMHNNKIIFIKNHSFKQLWFLTKLNLSHNHIHTLIDDFYNLVVLDIRSNNIYVIDVKKGKLLEKLYADEYWHCCINSDVECFAPYEVFSSCSDLLHYKAYYTWIWFVAFTSLAANIIVIISSKMKVKHGVNSLMMMNLAVSDLAYSIYLLIIAVSDRVYKGQYAVHNVQWRSSYFCHLAAILSSTSFLMSALCILSITFLRFYKIRYNSATTILDCKMFIIMSFIMLWIFIISSTVSVIIGQSLNEGKLFAQRNGLCLMTIGTFEPMEPMLIWSMCQNAIIICIIGIMLILYCKLYGHVKSVREKVQSMGSSNIKGNMLSRMSIKITLIIVTNVICWVPTVIVSILSAGGIDIHPSLTVATAIIFMPINSLINPILYNINEWKCGQKNIIK